MTPPHTPVLLAPILEHLARPETRRLADLTLGAGGHAAAMLEACPQATLLGVDRDPQALAIAAARLAPYADRARLVQGRFDEALEREAGFDGILADLGCSSMQLDTAERGFSFQKDALLDMRMGPDAPKTAAALLAELDEPALADILYRYGEEKAARRLARALVDARKLAPIATTAELARICEAHAARPRGRAKVHPATRAFQALRIAVNDELGVLERALPRAFEALAPGGRLAVIAFHSLEDRLVKEAFKALKKAGRGRLIGGKPIQADDEERARNPRARSARLRIIERTEEGS